eukprot:g34480.t1
MAPSCGLNLSFLVTVISHGESIKPTKWFQNVRNFLTQIIQEKPALFVVLLYYPQLLFLLGRTLLAQLASFTYYYGVNCANLRSDSEDSPLFWTYPSDFEEYLFTTFLAYFDFALIP